MHSLITCELAVDSENHLIFFHFYYRLLRHDYINHTRIITQIFIDICIRDLHIYVSEYKLNYKLRAHEHIHTLYKTYAYTKVLYTTPCITHTVMLCIYLYIHNIIYINIGFERFGLADQREASPWYKNCQCLFLVYRYC